MTGLTWETCAAACIVISAILIIATIVLKIANNEQCNTFEVPRYNETLRLMYDFRYKNRACRFTAQAIARYKIEALDDPKHEANKWKLNDFTAYALHSIITSDLLNNPRNLVIINDPDFTEIAADYDSSGSQFYNDDSRGRAMKLILKYPDTEDKQQSLHEAIKNMTDEQLFAMLIHGQPQIKQDLQ